VELSKLPKVDRVVDAPELDKVRRALGRRALTRLVRDAIAALRDAARDGHPIPDWAEVVEGVRAAGEARLRTGILPVINATGVILHTNLGRAPLGAASLENLARVAGAYSTLELDAGLGTRTRRGIQAEMELAELTGADDALLVNNNAAAVLLTLSVLAAGREVVVSRGELVEIGGGFRIPEVLARSGARLVEVGTTNRTRVADYARAIGDNTACLLRVHPSNFKITGFTERPSLSELAALAKERGLPLVKDLGGGLIVDLPESVAGSELAREPSVQRCLAAGASLVCFSLDKLFGGPQGGAVVGSESLVGKLREDPMARALRVDKLTLAALEPVLGAYRRDDLDAIPVHAMLRATADSLERRVEGWRSGLEEWADRTEIAHTEAAIGGGTLAEAAVASVALRVRVASPDRFAQALRDDEARVIARVSDDSVLLDARTVLERQDADIVAALLRVFRSLP
jgi:L-seryl-tRNA(Ser) seleniumtransferase